MTEDQLRKYIRNVILKDVAYARDTDKKSRPMVRAEFQNSRYWRYSNLQIKKLGVVNNEPVVAVSFEVDGVVYVHAEMGQSIGDRPVLDVVRYRVKGRYSSRITTVRHNSRTKRLKTGKSKIDGLTLEKRVGKPDFYTKKFAENAEKLVKKLHEAISKKIVLRGKQELIPEASE